MWIHQHWAGIYRGLQQGYCCPLPVKRVEIPKPNGGIRLLGIPSVHDRVIQQAITQVLQPLIDPEFSDHSHGFRPNRSAHDAVKSVQKGIKEGYGYAVDIDLSKFFDKVDHDLLMNRLGKWVTDKQVLALIGKYLRADVNVKGKLEATRGESLFLLKLVLGIPAQASGKNLTRPLMPSAPQTSCVRATSPLPS